MTDWVRHTPFSDPGRHRHLLRQLPSDIGGINAAARNVIGHYRAEMTELPESRRDEINSRWLKTILDVDQRRHPGALSMDRELAGRVAGCCRDHTLFVVAALREHGVPARSRVGFADYLMPGFHIDHVIVEYRHENRWRRTDPELRPGTHRFDPEDMPTGPAAPFTSAAEAWRAYRSGRIDPARYCVFPGSKLAGPDLIATYVFYETAHRYGDELLLWDDWGVTSCGAGEEQLTDDIAELLVRADAGDESAEQELADQYANDPRLHPGPSVVQHSPYDEPPREVSLLRSSTVAGVDSAEGFGHDPAVASQTRPSRPNS